MISHQNKVNENNIVVLFSDNACNTHSYQPVQSLIAGMPIMTSYIGHQFGNYRILRPLGEGHFATVYLAEHLYLETLAAIKVLHMRMEPESYEVFHREGRTIAHLQHPHIIRIIDFGFEDQTPYLVMEYIPNGSLRVRYPKGTCLSLEQIVDYVKQIASALDYAHEQRVIHHDVKPENLLLNAKGEIVLSDFGIAVVQRTLASLSEQNMAGTPRYMAPEQIRRQPCSASDQYALGVMVYEWLCGDPPFQGTLYEVLSHHLHQPPPSLCAHLPQLPPAVEDAVFGALAKDSAHRFPTVQGFASVLEEACFATQPLSAQLAIEAASSEHRTPSVTLPVPVPQPHMPSQPVSQRPLPISVVSVSALADRSYLEQWEAHLRPLAQAGVLTVWSESHILAGAAHQQQIDAHLDQADLIVLLLSADFFSSDDCIALMHRALQRQHSGAHVVPLLLRPVEWHASPLASLSCVPSNGLPVTVWTNRDAAFDSCVRDLRPLLGYPTLLTQRPQQALAPSSVAQRNRQILLRKVRSFWIEGVLNHSLHSAALLALGLETQSDAVAQPWRLVHQHPNLASLPLSPGTHITKVYDDADGELLILGAPGAGKTTLLLALARDLLARAQQDEHHPVPVVFNLSSWTNSLPLVEWLVAELNSKYQVPRKLGQKLITADQILPLLDGLDEVAAKDRTSCIETINDYRKEHGFLPLVVCSRSADYLALTTRVLLRSAVAIQSLNDQQVYDYLTKAGEPLQALRVALHRDPSLRELTHTPLMLSILTLTYHNAPVIDVLHTASSANRIQQVFEHYVNRMLVHESNDEHYPSQNTRQWLSWLAKQLKQRSQTVFYMERMQPDWLEERQGARQLYPRVVFGLIVGMLGIVGAGSYWRSILAIPYLKDILFNNHNSVLNLAYLIGLTLLLGLMNGSILGLVNGVLYKQGAEKESTSKVRWWWQQVRRRIVRSVLNGFLIGLLVGCPEGFILWYGDPHHDLPLSAWLLFTGVSTGISSGMLYGLIDGLLDIQMTKILPAETFAWLWTNMGRNLVKFLSLGLLCSLLTELLLGLLSWVMNYGDFFDNPLFLLQFALICVPPFALLSALLGGLTSGVSSDILDEQNFTVPNQGIRHSARYSVQVGIVTTSIVVGIAMLIAVSFRTGYLLPSFGFFGFVFGPLIGLVSALRAGGIACIQHVVLRWLLWKDKKMPWNYPRFLDSAAKRILLCKVGGGYMFVHRLLLEYFASLQEGSSIETCPIARPPANRRRRPFQSGGKPVAW